MKSEIVRLISEVGFQVIHTDSHIIEVAARIRSASLHRRAKIALADAIILISSHHPYSLFFPTTSYRKFALVYTKYAYLAYQIIKMLIISILTT